MWLKRIKYNIKKRSALSVVINSSGEVLLCCPLTLYVIMSLEFEYSLSQHAVSQGTYQWPNLCTRSTDSRARELIETHPPTVCFSVEINTIWIATKFNGAPKLLCFPHSSEYLPLCSAEQGHSYRVWTTWWWVYDDRIFIFGWNIPLKMNV